MLLALDIGNTNVVAGLFDGDEIRAEMRVATDRDRTADEWHVLWDSLLRIRGFGIGNVTGACIASVVPGLIAPFEVWLAEARVPTVTCRSGDDLGVGVDIDNPAEAGIDRVLNCLAAKHRHGAPAIVVDMGTATTFDVLSREGNYIGGAIAPVLLVDGTLRHLDTRQPIRVAHHMIGLAVTLGIAAISWLLVEQPMLRRKRAA